MRTTSSGLLGVTAECRDCGWFQQANNALGLAAQHADRTGHMVQVEQTISVIYNRRADA